MPFLKALLKLVPQNQHLLSYLIEISKDCSGLGHSWVHGYKGLHRMLILAIGSAPLSMLESFSGRLSPCVRKDGFWQPQVYIFMTCYPTGRETICLLYPYVKSIQSSLLVELLRSHASTCTTHIIQEKDDIG